MSAARYCRRDEDDVELIEDAQTDPASDPAPRQRKIGTGLDIVEMDVKFVDEQGKETVRTMVAKDHKEKLPQEPSSKPLANKHLRRAVSLMTALSGELIGTFLLTLVICTAVAAAVLPGSLVGIWQVGVVSGMGVAISIYCVSYISTDCHLNPAITVASAVVRYKSFSWKRIFPYIAVQMLGGILAGLVVFIINSGAISVYENVNGIERGENSSVITAMFFGEYFPNPKLYDHSKPESLQVISMFGALGVEAWTTSILAFVVFSLTNELNVSVGDKRKILAPLMIGLTVAIMISTYGHLTQVGMNPARDLGPRLAAACLGWGTVAIPGPRGGFWVYVVGPVLGALGGAALSDLVLSKAVGIVKKWKESETA